MKIKKRFTVIRPEVTIEYHGFRGWILAYTYGIFCVCKAGFKIFQCMPPWRFGSKPLFYIISIPKINLNKGIERMEVYIIEAYYCNGESEVKGVFSTFEKAKAHYDEHLKMDKNYSYTINKWTIDTGEPSGKWWGDEIL